MLPVVICEPDGAVRVQWMKVLSELIRRDYPSVRMEMLSGGEHELRRTLETEKGIVLAIIAVGTSMADGIDQGIELFLKVMEHNRDNYAMLCVHDAECLTAVLSRCMRPAGIMLLPLQEELMRASLRRIMNDYVSLYSVDDEQRHMVINSGKTMQRIAYHDILYLEAQDKQLNINTGRYVFTVRASLNSLAETLPEMFIRCHRSYIVNKAHIERLDLSEMEIRLTTQERIPVSRSYKDAIRTSLKADKWL